MNEKIIELKHRLAKIETLKDYQLELEKKFEDNSAKLQAAFLIVEKENKDVEKLQHASLSSVIAWFAKDKDERLAKEEQEALQAAVYLKQLQEENNVINEELVKCEEEIALEGVLQAKLAALEKKEALQGEKRHEVKPYYDQLEEAQRLEKELQEAIAAGCTVLEHLRLAIDELNDASSWGVIDVAGGGMVSSMVKHSHVDAAQAEIARIQQELLRFQKEVRDVCQIKTIDVSISDWLSFADVFVDGFIFDLMALSKIHQNQNKLQNLYQDIMEIQDRLLSEQCTCLERQIELKERIQQVLQAS